MRLDQEVTRVWNGISQRDERWLVRKDGSHFWALEITEAVNDKAGRRRGVVKVIRDETERKQFEERQSLLMSELSHRVKNTLATVQSIASQTLRGSTDPRQFVENLQARLQALSRAHSLLTRRNWDSADVTDLVRDQLICWTAISTESQRTARRPCLHPNRLLPSHWCCMNWERTPESTAHWQPKRGGLMSIGASGRQSRYCTLTGPRREALQWPNQKKRGFGARLIEKSLGGVGGLAELRFNADGLHCEIQIPLSPKNKRNTSRSEVA